MTLHKETLTEAELYVQQWFWVRSYTCTGCEEEISVYQKRDTNKWLFLTSEMTAHDRECGE